VETRFPGAPGRYGTLLDAIRLVAESASVDLDAVLDTLVAQARRLFGAADATINLRDEYGTFVRCRASTLVPPEHPLAAIGVPAKLTPLTPLVLQTRRAVGVDDPATDPRLAASLRSLIPGGVSELVAPLVAEDAVLGMLVVRWTERRAISPEELVLAETLGQHAGVAVRLARLMDEARGATGSGRGWHAGALATARAVMQRLDDALASVILNADLLEARADEPTRDRAAAVVRSAWRASVAVDHLREAIHFAQIARIGSGGRRPDGGGEREGAEQELTG
jgi:GAF domain-containing protein